MFQFPICASPCFLFNSPTVPIYSLFDTLLIPYNNIGIPIIAKKTKAQKSSLSNSTKNANEVSTNITPKVKGKVLTKKDNNDFIL